MKETFSATEAVQLAVVTRGDFVESRHLGSAVVLAPDGTEQQTWGNPAATILPRSAMKPIQAVAVMSAGEDLTGAEAAIAAGSHAGTRAHVELITTMLARRGLSPTHLQCPSDWPLDSDARDDLVRHGGTPSPITHTCSGQHTGMLLACAGKGWDTAHYLHPTHSVQEHIHDIAERLTGEKIAITETDGCGAPTYGVSLVALARGIQRIATAANDSPFALFRYAATLRDAVLANPWALDGHGRVNTIVVKELGVFAKWGAEGLMVMAAPDGTTATLKIIDGSLRAATIVALALLTQAGSLDATAVTRILPLLHLSITGGAKVVGSISPTL